MLSSWACLQSEVEKMATKLNYNAKGDIALPSCESRLGINRSDWNRIKRLISNRPRNKYHLNVWSSVLYGISGSAGLSIIPIYFSSNLPSWVIPLYVCICIFTLLMAVILTILNKRINKEAIEYDDLIIKDMGEVESTLEITENKSSFKS